MDKNILIIDDDFDARSKLKKVLVKDGYNVYLAKDKRVVFNFLSHTPVHLILLDLSPENKSGFEIYNKIKNDKILSGIPIIAVSSSRFEDDAIKAIDYGATDFIEKPLNHKILTAKIRSVLTLKEEEENLRKGGEELVHLIKDASEQKEQLSQEAEFSRDLNQFLDAESKKTFIREKLPNFLGARLITIFTIDENEQEFKLFVTNHKDISTNLIVPVDRKSIMYEVLRTKSPQFLKDFSKSRYRKSRRSKYNTDLVCSIPLISGDRTIGVLNVNGPCFVNRESIDFEGRIVRISRHLAISLHNTILFEKVKDLSMRDSMTGLYNFRHFLETLRLEVERAKRYNEFLSCIMVDLDDFKLINDTYGHHVGDLVLKELAQSISIAVRSSDIPARYGGDEFVILLPRTDKRYAGRMAQRLMKLFSGKDIQIPDEEKSVNVTLSMGIAGLPDDTLDMEELVKKADAALYRAKSAGKNRVVLQ